MMNERVSSIGGMILTGENRSTGLGFNPGLHVCRPETNHLSRGTALFDCGKVVNGKVVPVHEMKAYGGGRGMVPLILNLGTT
jgi:hypothetical protein